MTLEELNDIIESKINQNENFIIFTFYELMVKRDVHKSESDAVINLIKTKLINYNYDVYTTGESYTFNSVTYTVPVNISLIAIKKPHTKWGFFYSLFHIIKFNLQLKNILKYLFCQYKKIFLTYNN